MNAITFGRKEAKCEGCGRQFYGTWPCRKRKYCSRQCANAAEIHKVNHAKKKLYWLTARKIKQRYAFALAFIMLFGLGLYSRKLWGIVDKK